MKLCKLIVQSTLSNPLPSNSTEVEAENVIKEWLRLSDRKGGRRKREEKNKLNKQDDQKWKICVKCIFCFSFTAFQS
ncbi:hypothetical protein AOXY_G4599 [Acipenser oxyrinchus oxyrinchus]|uniref:Uncharacterized protein n=1 Tax=Acipenser oxyrinchus oxyrinchus TaxID=40147 RepID=A0AAD8LPV1_ACIOX|nr:hypothetical protein AOXY_G4599 [Acipenser oxyrinchus oxyrinchus]